MTQPPWRLEHHESLASTQDACRSAAEAGDPGRLAVRADVQTRGRGTKGRTWRDAPGNLALSVLLRPRTEAAQVGQWAILAAVAVAETIRGCLPATIRPRLKWPNDVVLHGGKVAGVLTEAALRPDGECEWVVIGFGVNLTTAPPIAGRATTALAEYAAPPDPATFAAALLARLDHWDAERARVGFAAIRSAWLDLGPKPATRLAIRSACGSLWVGRYVGLADDGGLCLDIDGATRAFTSGEVEEVAPCCS